MARQKEAKWFKELKKNRAEFYHVSNIIDSAKFKYERELHLTEWLLGTGIGLFFAIRVLDLLNNPNQIIAKVGFYGSIIFLVEIFVTSGIIVWLDKRQKVAMRYLYREKDKEEKEKKS